MEILIKAVYILIFPGLLFASVFGLWLAGVDRKLLARMQKRVGPPILQPTYDFFKLLGKETIVPANAARLPYLAAPYVGLVSLVVTALFIPLGGLQAFGGTADTVVILYLLAIPSLAIIFGGAASGSPFAGVGVSRSMVAIMSYELPRILVLLAVGRAAQARPIYMYQRLETPGHKWGVFGVFSLLGNIAIMAFYTVVTGWILYYFVKFLTGQHADFGFAQMIADPGLNVTYLLVVVIAAFVLLSFNLLGGLALVTKYMMSAMLVLMLVLAVHSLTIAGASEGLRIYKVTE